VERNDKAAAGSTHGAMPKTETGQKRLCSEVAERSFDGESNYEKIVMSIQVNILTAKCLLVLLIILQGSCSTTIPAMRGDSDKLDAVPASRKNESSAVPAQRDSDWSVIGLSARNRPPEFETKKRMTTVPSGKSVGQEAQKGAAAGVGACAKAASWEGSPPGGQPLGAVAIFILCAPLGLVGGAVVGGVSAADSHVDEAAIAQNELRGIASTIQNDVLNALEEYAAEAGVSAEKLRDEGVRVAGNVTTKQFDLPRASFHYVLEVDVVRLAAIDATEPLTWEDNLRVEARIRMTRFSDRNVMDRYTFVRPPLKYESRWTNASFKKVFREVAETALDESVLIYRGEKAATKPLASSNSAHGQNPGDASSISPYPDYTIRLLNPLAFGMEALHSRLKSNDTTGLNLVSELRPVFRWEPLPASFYRDTVATEIQNLSYEFKLYKGMNTDRGAFVLDEREVYIRSGLTLPTHVMETDLSACTPYFWTVRAHFTLKGRPRVTEWSGLYNAGGLAIDPSWYRRNSFPDGVPHLPNIIYYPQFRTGNIPGSEVCEF
jgi:hypothetical protein